MDPIHSRIQSLLQAYLDGTGTAAEFGELLDLWPLHDPAGVDSILQGALAKASRNPAEDSIEWEAMLARIIAIAPAPGEVANQASVKKLLPFRRFAAAAVALLILSLGTYYILTHRSAPTNQPTIAATKDLPPGGNRALLTLSNGQKIMLDSAHNGQLASQGNTKITKLDNGHLAYLPSKPGGAVVFNTLTTPRGGQYQLTLPDGSRVWLDAASSITYPTAFIGTDRKVAITGQVYFEIVHDPRKPFHVSTPNADIRDIGTEFNINSYNDEPQSAVTLVQGAIAVRHGKNNLILSPGQQARVYPSGEIRLDPAADIEQATAWKNGLFQFHSATMGSLLRQISRWYNVEVEYPGGEPQGHISGKFSRNMTLSKVEKALELSGVHFTIQENKIIVMP